MPPPPPPSLRAYPSGHAGYSCTAAAVVSLFLLGELRVLAGGSRQRQVGGWGVRVRCKANGLGLGWCVLVEGGGVTWHGPLVITPAACAVHAEVPPMIKAWDGHRQLPRCAAGLALHARGP